MIRLARVVVTITLEEMPAAESAAKRASAGSNFGATSVRTLPSSSWLDLISLLLIVGKGNMKERKNFNWRRLCFFVVVVCRSVEESENL